MTDRRPCALLAMSPDLPARLFDPPALERMARIAKVDTTLVIDDLTLPRGRAALAEAEVLLTSWGAPLLDQEALRGAPNLRAVVHAAGSIKHHVTAACWERGLAVSSAAAANAVPVAEYTTAAIVMANKRVFPIRARFREAPAVQGPDWMPIYPQMGNYDKVIGVVGCSTIGRLVIEAVNRMGMRVLVYDPYLDPIEAARLGAVPVDLDTLVSDSDVVTLHAPATPETSHMMDGRRLSLMRDGATLINTARGSLVDTDALTAELSTGRISAVIDVTEPEILPADSPLLSLENVLLTPHIAGSLGTEMRRMGQAALDELERYAQGLPFAHPVMPERLAHSA
ncbi:hydroxyacid dehydrogenase [Streptosporangium canum]|uniref:hydroxyacid dehydrogenase n=1 Tax=Streptosporangium canum TaxID=324952 RepID=UPI0033B887BD